MQPMDIFNLKVALSKLESVGEQLLESRVEALVEKSSRQLSAGIKGSIAEASKKVEHNVGGGTARKAFALPCLA